MAAEALSKPFLVGTWRGQGAVLPRDIKYNEVSTFTLLRTEPAVIVNWQQFTKSADSGAPMHAENGFLKILPMPAGDSAHKAELLLSHPFGVNEMYTNATFDFGSQTLTCEASDKDGSFQRSPFAKGRQTTSVKRVYRLEGDKLVYDMYLGVEGAEQQHHLHCEMVKDSE
mmetsp:Transcript_23428/g.59862  ORF Transcript_23428/g.59862 Transcript_23428/m.59862 type:complete len:170 (-) Transcript_23428:89-598(-)